MSKLCIYFNVILWFLSLNALSICSLLRRENAFSVRKRQTCSGLPVLRPISKIHWFLRVWCRCLCTDAGRNKVKRAHVVATALFRIVTAKLSQMNSPKWYVNKVITCASYPMLFCEWYLHGNWVSRLCLLARNVFSRAWASAGESDFGAAVVITHLWKY